MCSARCSRPLLVLTRPISTQFDHGAVGLSDHSVSCVNRGRRNRTQKLNHLVIRATLNRRYTCYFGQSTTSDTLTTRADSNTALAYCLQSVEMNRTVRRPVQSRLSAAARDNSMNRCVLHPSL